MLRIIFLLIFFFVIAMFGVWLAEHDFVISGEFQGRLIETTAVYLFIIVVFFFIIFYGIVRFLSWLTNSPARISERVKRGRSEQGYKDLMSGFSALASGDIEYAKKLASRSEKSLENQPLVKLLQAQVAVTANRPADAEKYYGELAQIESSRVIGYRGLIAQAIQNDEFHRALELAEDLLKLSPRSKWINEAVIDLSLREEDWERAEKYATRAQKNSALNKIESKIYLSIIHYLKAKEYYAGGNVEKAREDLKIALKVNPKFLPASILYAEILVDLNETREAEEFIEKTWAQATHPRLLGSYARVTQGMPIDKRLKRMQKFMKIEPKSIYAILAYAKAAIEAGELDKAKEELQRGLTIRETESLCNMLALIDNSTDWNKRAEHAESDKCWHCVETGARYHDWQPFSENGSFNSIQWDYAPEGPQYKNKMGKFLLIK